MSDEDKLEYRANPEFNEWLDSDSENIVQVAGYTFLPSDTLYTMNYGQYIAAHAAYLEDDEILLQDIYADFPTPIAFYLYQAQENYDNPHHRLDLLKSAWEALILFLYGVVVGEARHRQIPLKETGVELKAFYSDRLAQKLLIIENILDLCGKKGYTLSCSKVFTIDAIAKLRKLNQKRNEFEHSFAATPEEQQKSYSELLPEMMAVIKLLRNLDRISLFRYHSNSDGGLFCQDAMCLGDTHLMGRRERCL